CRRRRAGRLRLVRHRRPRRRRPELRLELRLGIELHRAQHAAEHPEPDQPGRAERDRLLLQVDGHRRERHVRLGDAGGDRAMRARLRDESGMALATTIMLLLIIMGLGLAITASADNQQSAARIERSRESSFTEAEAVLNAQTYQLARSWPTAAAPATSPCRPSTAGAGTAATTCPDPASLAGTFA